MSEPENEREREGAGELESINERASLPACNCPYHIDVIIHVRPIGQTYVTSRPRQQAKRLEIFIETVQVDSVRYQSCRWSLWRIMHRT